MTSDNRVRKQQHEHEYVASFRTEKKAELHHILGPCCDVDLYLDKAARSSLSGIYNKVSHSGCCSYSGIIVAAHMIFPSFRVGVIKR